LKWVLRVSPNGNDEVVWKDEDGDLAPKERYEIDQGYLARIRGGGRSSLFSLEEPPLHAARREAWSSGKVVDIDLNQSVNQWYFDNVLNPRISAWLDEQASANADSGTLWQRSAEGGRNPVVAAQLRAAARGYGQIGADILGVAMGINVGLLDVGTGTGRASIQFKNGEIDGLQYTTAIVNDIGTTASAPLIFLPATSAPRALGTRASTGNLGVSAQRGLTREALLDSIKGVAPGDRVAASIVAGDIKVCALGDRLFEKAVRLRDPGISDATLAQTRALQWGEHVYLRSSSRFLDADLVHEGTHVLDWFRGGVRYNSVYLSELSAYKAQRAFQMGKYGSSEFDSWWSMINHIFKNY